MGKGKGNNPLKPRPMPPSFFMQMRQKNGDNWLNMVSTEFIRKNAMRIFKDLATGAANVDTEYQYFLNYDFTYNLAVAASDNANYNRICYLGICNSPVPVDKEMVRVANDQLDKFNVYNMIVSYMNNILQDLTFNGGTLCRYYLQEMVASIRYKRNAFNGNFITLPKENDRQHLKLERRNRNHGYEFDKDDSGTSGFFSKPPETHL